MSLNEETYRRLQKEVTFAKEESQRAKGALDQLMTRLKDEFDCDDVKAAKTLLESLERQSKKAEKAFEEALADYEKRWKQDKEE